MMAFPGMVFKYASHGPTVQFTVCASAALSGCPLRTKEKFMPSFLLFASQIVGREIGVTLGVSTSFPPPPPGP